MAEKYVIGTYSPRAELITRFGYVNFFSTMFINSLKSVGAKLGLKKTTGNYGLQIFVVEYDTHPEAPETVVMDTLKGTYTQCAMVAKLADVNDVIDTVTAKYPARMNNAMHKAYRDDCVAALKQVFTVTGQAQNNSTESKTQ